MWASDACQTGGCWDSLHNICYSSCCLFCCWCATHSGGSKGRQSVEAHLGGGHTTPCLHLWLQSRGSYVFDLLDCAVHWEDSTAWWESAHVPGWSQRNHRLSGLSLLDQASPVLLAWVPSMALFICNESTWREPSLFSPRNSSLTLLKTHTCPSWNCPSLCYVLRLFTRCIFFFFCPPPVSCTSHGSSRRGMCRRKENALHIELQNHCPWLKGHLVNLSS